MKDPQSHINPKKTEGKIKQMKRKPLMTLENHLKTAEDLRIAQKHLHRAFFRVQDHFALSSKLMKMMIIVG